MNCPLCGRFLGKLNENGSFDLAGKTSVQLLIQFPPLEDTSSQIDPTTFKCEKLICRLKRWWKNK